MVRSVAAFFVGAAVFSLRRKRVNTVWELAKFEKSEPPLGMNLFTARALGVRHVIGSLAQVRCDKLET